MSAWDEIDEPVLRWLLAQDSNPDWRGRSEELPHAPTPAPTFRDDLNSRQVDEALERLAGHGLISGQRETTNAYAFWIKLRLTASGLVLLGEWPDLDRVSGARGLATVLSELAGETADPEDKRALRKAAGAVTQLGEAIVTSALESVGGELA